MQGLDKIITNFKSILKLSKKTPVDLETLKGHSETNPTF